MKYFLSEKGKTCWGPGVYEVANSKTCRKAAEELQLHFQGTKNTPNWPKGCYGTYEIYFNKHWTGSYGSSERKMCVKFEGKIIKFCHTLHSPIIIHVTVVKRKLTLHLCFKGSHTSEKI